MSKIDRGLGIKDSHDRFTVSYSTASTSSHVPPLIQEAIYMAVYRFYIIGSDGQLTRAVRRDCPEDEAAIEQAEPAK